MPDANCSEQLDRILFGTFSATVGADPGVVDL